MLSIIQSFTVAVCVLCCSHEHRQDIFSKEERGLMAESEGKRGEKNWEGEKKKGVTEGERGVKRK